MTVSVVDAVIDARKASALGMIVSEFVANSTKHAFPDGRQGEVEISLSKDADENWVLLCQDNGVGRQDTQDPAAPESTGLGQLLMSPAATQLSGQISYDSGPLGTTLTVNFGNDPNRSLHRADRQRKRATHFCVTLFNLSGGNQLLDFAFLVLNVLAHNWVVLVDCHLLSHRTCVFLRDVKMASTRSGVQADFDCGWLRHISYLLECGPSVAQRMNSYICRLLQPPPCESTAKRGFQN